MVSFPTTMTEEEEALQKKYAKLKKKVRRDRRLDFVGNQDRCAIIGPGRC